MSLQDVVNVSIVRGTKSITRAGFGRALVLGDNATTLGVYANLAEVAAGFSTSDAEYIAARSYFGQERKPRSLLIGPRTTKVAQVHTITPTAANNFTYVVTINGVEFSFLSDSDATVNEIVAGLIALINAGAEPVTASGTTTLILTADVAGNGFTSSVGTNLSKVVTTPSNGVAEDILAAVEDSEVAGLDWYGLLLTSRNNDDIMNAAATIETMRRIFLTSTQDSDVLTSVTTDVASKLKARAYARTAYLYSADQENYPDAAWIGNRFPTDPGSSTWAYKVLAGIAPDKFSSTQAANLAFKLANTYTTIAGANVTGKGKVAANEWIDTIVFIDWLQAQLEETIFAKLISSEKIPYTDPGVSIIEGLIRGVLDRGIRVGGLAADPAPEVFVPLVADVPEQDRQDRLLPDVTFNATLAGAIHEIEIDGVVSV